MFSCAFCKLDILEPKKYLHHVQYAHGIPQKYPCGITSCPKIFTTIGSLRAHVYNKHKKTDFVQGRTIQDNPEVIVSIEKNVSDVHRVCTGRAEEVFIPQKNTQESTTNNACGTRSKIDPAVMLAAKFYDYPDIARVRTNQIISETAKFSEEIVQKLQSSILQSVSDGVVSVETIQTIFEKHGEPFAHLKTEHMSFKTFETHETFIPPESYLLGDRPEFVLHEGNQEMDMIPVTAQFVPLRLVFRNFFELPSVLEKTLEYMKTVQSQSEIISNFIQGELWKNLSANDGDKIVLPLMIYFDDYENNNPLGSHKGISKCSAIYASILCLPPHLSSKLQNIFLFVLFNTLDRQYFKHEVIFSKIKDELYFLEHEGITITTPTGCKTIFFRLALISGDNLGLSYMLGFQECFSHGKMCRICLISKEDINNVFQESYCELRSKDNYESDLKDHDRKNTGLTGKCVFLGVGGYHPLVNLYIDVVHDWMEGANRYDSGHILHYFIKKKKYFTLKDLNNRIRGFNYGSLKNKPPQILESQLSAKEIKISAAEMLSLIRYLPLIIGHLIPADDRVWELFLQIHNITNILTSYDLPVGSHEILDVKITEYLKLLVSLFPHSMKPKHHFLLHYGRVLLLCGPLWKICTIRPEGKHREGKITSRAAISRVNVCKTIGVKHQLRLNYRFLQRKPYDELTYDKGSMKKMELLYLKGIHDVKESVHFCNKPLNTTVRIIKKIEFHEIGIKIKDVIMIPNQDGPVFFHVEHIVMFDNDNECVFIVKQLQNVFLDEHTRSYEIIDSQYTWATLCTDDLYGCFMTQTVRTMRGKFIVKKWF